MKDSRTKVSTANIMTWRTMNWTFCNKVPTAQNMRNYNKFFQYQMLERKRGLSQQNEDDSAIRGCTETTASHYEICLDITAVCTRCTSVCDQMQLHKHCVNQQCGYCKYGIYCAIAYNTIKSITWRNIDLDIYRKYTIWFTCNWYT